MHMFVILRECLCMVIEKATRPQNTH